MGNVVTRLTQHKSRHVHHEVTVPIPPPPNHIDESSTSTHPSAIPPAKPALLPVPEEIIAATERGMISENFICSGLPSPVLHHSAQQAERTAQYHYFPEPSFEQRQQQQQQQSMRVGSLDSNESQGHESEAKRVVLTRGEEACGGEGKRGSVSGRVVKWKGVDC